MHFWWWLACVWEIFSSYSLNLESTSASDKPPCMRVHSGLGPGTSTEILFLLNQRKAHPVTAGGWSHRAKSGRQWADSLNKPSLLPLTSSSWPCGVYQLLANELESELVCCKMCVGGGEIPPHTGRTHSWLTNLRRIVKYSLFSFKQSGDSGKIKSLNF